MPLGPQPGYRACRMATTRILLVDDYELYLRGVQKMLERHHGVEVVGTAKSGEEALAFAPQLRPDLVLLDFRLPGLNGLETARQLQALDPAPAIVIVTGHDDPEYREAARREGLAGWIAKMDLWDELPAVLHSMHEIRRTMTSPDSGTQ